MATYQLFQSHIATDCTRGSQNSRNIKTNWEMQKTRHSLQPLLQIYVSIKLKTDKSLPPSTQPDSRCWYEMEFDLLYGGRSIKGIVCSTTRTPQR